MLNRMFSSDRQVTAATCWPQLVQHLMPGSGVPAQTTFCGGSNHIRLPVRGPTLKSYSPPLSQPRMAAAQGGMTAER